MKKMREKITKSVLISVIFGLLAAVAGTFATISFLAPGNIFTKIDYVSESQNQQFLKTSLGIKAYGRLEIFEFLDKALPSTAAIYQTKASSSKFSDSLYFEKDRLGSGFILTSDGWLISGKDVVTGANGKITPQNISVAVKNKVYKAVQIITDPWTSAVFIKINATELPVITLGDSSGLKLGDIVFSGTNKNNFWFSYATAINYYPERGTKEDIILSSEVFGKVIKLQDAIPEELSGGMISNRNGEAVGLLVSNSKNNHVIPINYFKNAVTQILKNKKIARPYLGVNYIDLSFAVANDLSDTKGAYISGGNYLKAIDANSPAQKAGLKSGDVILSVLKDEVNEQANLAEIISEYEPGQKIKLQVMRDKKKIEVEIILGKN